MFLPLIGIEVSFVMMFYEYVFTNLHLHSLNMSVPLWTYFIQIFFIHSSYGIDRYFDVIKNDSDNTELISYINNNTKYVQSTIFISILLSTLALGYFEQSRILIPLYYLSIFYYRDFKKLFPLLKPLFISIILITSSIIYPSIITENNFNILQDFNALIPPITNMYSASNALDIIDYNVDKLNNIYTLPVMFGNNTAVSLSVATTVISALSHIQHPSFGINPVDFVFQAQNIFSGISLIHNNKNNNFKDQRKQHDNNPKMSAVIFNNRPINHKHIIPISHKHIIPISHKHFKFFVPPTSMFRISRPLLKLR